MLDDFFIINIGDYITKDGVLLGENVVKSILSAFSCYKNPDVEKFLREQAINFTKKHQSVTYLVMHKDTNAIVGYFTLAIKPLRIHIDNFSNTMKRKILRVSRLDEETGKYAFSAYLIAQLGKNFALQDTEMISGEILLKIAINKIKEIQHMAGGMVYFLEAEDKPKLLSFYERNGFKKFDTKATVTENTCEHKLIQLLKVL